MQRYARSMKVTSAFQAKKPITNDEIQHYAPSIMSGSKHESRSAGYTYVPTIQVIDKLRQEGFQPFYVAQSGSRDETKQGFTRHLVRLRHVNHIGQDDVNEVVLMNSHDGTSSYQMMAGVFRFVCANGLFAGDTVSDIRIPHRGNIVDDVIEGSYRIVQDFDVVNEQKELMKSTTLSDLERRAYARSALALRYPLDGDNKSTAPYDANLLLSTYRHADRAPTLWNTFNVVQENIIRPRNLKYVAVDANGKRVNKSVRGVGALKDSPKINKALWTLSQTMLHLQGEGAVAV